MDRKVIFDEALFDAKFIKGTEDDCWLWTAAKNKKGYGQFGICKNGNKAKSLASRISLYRKLGYDDIFWFSKLQAGHTCANTSCVNPNHLIPQTPKENIAEKYSRLGNSYNARGFSHGRSKLTEEQVLAIRAIEGKPYTQIAKEYGVSQPLISHIINRKTWTHI
jgi:hypothetical protein